MSKFNLKNSVSLVIAAIGGRDVLADQIGKAHHAGVVPAAWYKALSQAVIQDHLNGLDHPQLVVVEAQREQTSGINAGTKKGDLMIDLAKGQGKSIKNRITQWQYAVDHGLNPREGESVTAWLSRAEDYNGLHYKAVAALPDALNTLASRGYSIPETVATDRARLFDLTGLATLARQPNESLTAYIAARDAELAELVRLDADPAPVVDAAPAPAPAPVVDAAPAPVVDAAPAPAPVVDAAPAPAPVVESAGKPDPTGKQVSRATREKVEKVVKILEKEFSQTELLALAARIVAGITGAGFDLALTEIELAIDDINDIRKVA